MFRKLYIATTLVLMLVVMGATVTGCPEDLRSRYKVTVQNLTPLQTYAPLIAVTHSNNVAVFREGTAASADFVEFVTDADLAGLVAALDSLDAVTAIYQFAAGLDLPTTACGTITFSMLAQPNDVFSIAAPAEVALTDAFAGLDSVALPILTRTYYMDSYVLDAGNVELAAGIQNLVRVTITRQ